MLAPHLTSAACEQEDVHDTRISLALRVRASRRCIGMPLSAKVIGSLRAASVALDSEPLNRMKTTGCRVFGTHHRLHIGSSLSLLLRLKAQRTLENLSGAGTMNGGVQGDLVLFPGRSFGLIVCMFGGAEAGKIPAHQTPLEVEHWPKSSTHAPFAAQVYGFEGVRGPRSGDSQEEPARRGKVVLVRMLGVVI
jgi:hypothetical protein